MIINGEKFACDTCIRGHRAAQCQHTAKVVLFHNAHTVGLFASLDPYTQCANVPLPNEATRVQAGTAKSCHGSATPSSSRFDGVSVASGSVAPESETERQQNSTTNTLEPLDQLSFPLLPPDDGALAAVDGRMVLDDAQFWETTQGLDWSGLPDLTFAPEQTDSLLSSFGPLTISPPLPEVFANIQSQTDQDINDPELFAGPTFSFQQLQSWQPASKDDSETLPTASCCGPPIPEDTTNQETVGHGCSVSTSEATIIQKDDR
ncbi:hypothetical protein S7711_02343 [Stachybotrys chartarum IBT 7711]|uniref:Copper-fist domain-containing protein n=1 Tax=Stachybotrys chartarum (strain CBS 109288 / IBT 7711) TaxID=1280523 RepID=A0A084B107_STACB|nr:hypothetical protein S7711_02343 [Stachybotrys chartarum IBT 7711]